MRYMQLDWRRKQSQKRQIPQEAGATLFQGLRVRLTLWYCAIMAVALVVFGVALYFSTQDLLLRPTKAEVKGNAEMHVQRWLSDSLAQACQAIDNPPNPFGSTNQPPSQSNQSHLKAMAIIACFDQHGTLLSSQNTSMLPSAFLANNLAKKALQTGQDQDDTIDTGTRSGQYYRYAIPVPNPSGNGYLGVMVVGESIQIQQGTLSLLLGLLLLIGGVALLIAVISGLFLANSALAPARLAWHNQQRFIADASHELRTPLTLLRADAEVLLRGRERLDEEDAFLLEDIVQETNHMSHIATNLLTLARLDSRTTHQEHEVVSLTNLARLAIQRVQALADQQNISLHLTTDEQAIVVGDPTLLQQAMIALLDNAIKYNRPMGHISLRTQVQGEQAVLEVQDTGIGITSEHLPHLGERFYRVDKARAREAGGTGLGLSIVHGIATTHSGTFHIQSVPEQGTTVTIRLPLAHTTDASRLIENELPAMR